MIKIAIIGASVAGHTLVLNLREKNKDCQITLISEEGYPFYDRRLLLDFLAGRIKEEDLFKFKEDSYAKDNINFTRNKKVNYLNLQKKNLQLKTKEIINYDFLVICSGRRYVLPEIPGANKPGVFTLYSLSDFKQFLDYFISDSVCLVGSDDFAVNTAGIIASKNKEVKLVSSRDLSSISLPSRIKVINSEILEIIGESVVQAVKFKEGKIIACQSVVFLDKKESSIDFLKGTNIELSQGLIAVDDFGQTNYPGIYACGSVAGSKLKADNNKSWDEVLAESARLSDYLSGIAKG
ncbi:MAG: FAD-dependent oxidoreductase [Candidatus Omnitrophota bacterium]